MKKIDVIMASYNGEKFIEEQIKSILINFDNVSNYECRLLISDDLSQDNTAEIIKKNVLKDKRIIFVDGNKKGGVRENFEFIMKFAQADYIFFSDQDDFWIPNKILIFIENFLKIEKNKINTPILIHSDLCVVDENLLAINTSMFNYQKINKNPTFAEIMTGNSVTGCAMACNNILLNSIKENKGINNSIMHDWYIAMYASAFGVLSFIDKPLVLYRQHQSNQVGAKSLKLNDILKKNNIINIINKSKISIEKTKQQAHIFLSNFGNYLDEDKILILKMYIESSSLNIFDRLKLFLFKNINKKGFLRNVVFFMLFVFGL